MAAEAPCLKADLPSRLCQAAGGLNSSELTASKTDRLRRGSFFETRSSAESSLAAPASNAIQGFLFPNSFWGQVMVLAPATPADRSVAAGPG